MLWLPPDDGDLGPYDPDAALAAQFPIRFAIVGGRLTREGSSAVFGSGQGC